MVSQVNVLLSGHTGNKRHQKTLATKDYKKILAIKERFSCQQSGHNERQGPDCRHLPADAMEFWI